MSCCFLSPWSCGQLCLLFKRVDVFHYFCCLIFSLLLFSLCLDFPFPGRWCSRLLLSLSSAMQALLHVPRNAQVESREKCTCFGFPVRYLHLKNCMQSSCTLYLNFSGNLPSQYSIGQDCKKLSGIFTCNCKYVQAKTRAQVNLLDFLRHITCCITYFLILFRLQSNDFRSLIQATLETFSPLILVQLNQ